MFERYTEKARRVIFFARYEAAQAETRMIEPAHLLLGILREDPGLMESCLLPRKQGQVYSRGNRIAKYTGKEKITPQWSFRWHRKRSVF